MRRFTAILTAFASLLLPTPVAADAPRLNARTVQTGLEIPWDIAFAPDGKMLVTERPGRIRVYSDRFSSGKLLSTTTVQDVRAEYESGVMGIAVKREATQTSVFVCASRDVAAGWRNQVLRYRLGTAGRLHFQRVILGGMRAATIHNGCAVQIGPDGKLWVGMGDANDPALAQKKSSRNGKILRVNLDGSIPEDNPFAGSPVYALGLRNPQGIAFHPRTGRAYSIEHGPDVNDEINRLRPGRNYGWPCWTGWATRNDNVPAGVPCGGADDYKHPAWASGNDGTYATSGGVFMAGAGWGAWENHLFVATLKESDVRHYASSMMGSRLYERKQSVLFNERWGRLRGAVRAPGTNVLYLTTSTSTDGVPNNDRIIRVRPR